MTSAFRHSDDVFAPIAVPSWFLRFVAPLLAIAALPLAVIVFAGFMGAAAATAVLGRLRRRAKSRDSAAVDPVVIDGTYVVVEDGIGNGRPVGGR